MIILFLDTHFTAYEAVYCGTELRRLPCVIVDVNYDKYQLACQWGILEDLYGAQHLEMYHGLIEFDISKITDKISLRTVCIKIADRNKPIKEIEIECNCNGKFTYFVVKILVSE